MVIAGTTEKAPRVARSAPLPYALPLADGVPAEWHGVPTGSEEVTLLNPATTAHMIGAAMRAPNALSISIAEQPQADSATTPWLHGRGIASSVHPREEARLNPGLLCPCS